LRYEESAHTEKRTETDRLLKQREGDIARGRPMSGNIGRLTFDEAAIDLLSNYRINGKRSLANVRDIIIGRGLAPWFRDRRMATVTTAHIEDYIASRLDKGYANATINHVRLRRQ
jgi:hypothetical protein